MNRNININSISSRIRGIFFIPAVVLLFILYSSVAPLFAIISGSLKNTYSSLAKIWARHVLKFANISVQVNKLENIPHDETCIFVSNHQSMMDIFICFACIPLQIGFFAKKSLFRIPYYGWVLAKSSSLPVDRKDARKDHVILENAVQAVKNGQHLIIYPEGTRSGKAELNRFKRGCLFLAGKSQATIVPTAIKDSYKTAKKGSMMVFPAQTSITFGKPFKVPENMTKQEQQKILEKLENEIKIMISTPTG